MAEFDQDSTGPREKLYRAPLNSVGRPSGPNSSKGYFGRQPVIARLEWAHWTDLVPAVVLWREAGRVLIEWSPSGTAGAARVRQTWLPEDDVRPYLRLDGLAPDAPS